MYQILKTAVLASALAVSSAWGAAATTLQYDITGDATLSFQLDQMPSPVDDDTLGFAIDDFFGPSQDLRFTGSTFGGGLDFFIGSTLFQTGGAQLITGSFAAPTLSTGSFTLTGLFATNGTFNLLVSEVPEEPETPQVPLPAAGWMLLVAAGGLGVAARRKKRTS